MGHTLHYKVGDALVILYVERGAASETVMKAIRQVLAASLRELMPAMTTDLVLTEVRAERARQDQKWGGPRHDDTHNLFYHAALISERASITPYAPAPLLSRKELVEIAAVAVAAIESIDRRVAAGTLKGRNRMIHWEIMKELARRYRGFSLEQRAEWPQR